MSEPSLDMLLYKLKLQRELALTAKQILAEERAKLEPYTLRVIETQHVVDELEAEIRKAALELYLQDPNKKKEIHAKIKERDVVSIKLDEHAALEFAKLHGLWLSLDKKGLETYIKSLKGIGVPSFAQVITTPSITIAQEL